MLGGARGFAVGPGSNSPTSSSTARTGIRRAPAITREGSKVRLKGRTFLSSPDAYRLRMQMSVGDEPFSNFGTLRWERVLDL